MTQQSTVDELTDVTEQQVRDYLLSSPEFFTNHPELLEEIKVKDQGGDVISLTMRQLALLRDKNAKLQHQLEGLLDIARENDALFGRMQRLTTALLDARSVEDVYATLDDTLRDCFGADFFALRLIADEEGADFPITDIMWAKDSVHIESFKRLIDSQQIKCGHPTHAQAEALFDEQAEKVQSAALIPLKINDQDGVLAIGSQDADRFHTCLLYTSDAADE